MRMEELVQDMSVTIPVSVPPNTVATCVKVGVRTTAHMHRLLHLYK